MKEGNEREKYDITIIGKKPFDGSAPSPAPGEGGLATVR